MHSPSPRVIAPSGLLRFDFMGPIMTVCMISFVFTGCESEDEAAPAAVSVRAAIDQGGTAVQSKTVSLPTRPPSIPVAADTDADRLEAILAPAQRDLEGPESSPATDPESLRGAAELDEADSDFRPSGAESVEQFVDSEDQDFLDVPTDVPDFDPLAMDPLTVDPIVESLGQTSQFPTGLEDELSRATDPERSDRSMTDADAEEYDFFSAPEVSVATRQTVEDSETALPLRLIGFVRSTQGDVVTEKAIFKLGDQLLRLTAGSKHDDIEVLKIENRAVTIQRGRDRRTLVLFEQPIVNKAVRRELTTRSRRRGSSRSDFGGDNYRGGLPDDFAPSVPAFPSSEFRSGLRRQESPITPPPWPPEANDRRDLFPDRAGDQRDPSRDEFPPWPEDLPDFAPELQNVPE